MSLSLNNSLSATASIQIDAANEKAKVLGQSLATGRNANVGVVEGFLGRNLESTAFTLKAIANGASYANNVLLIAGEYTESIITALQSGLKIVSISSSASEESLAVLQRSMDETRKQMDLLIEGGQFDSKKIFQGGAKNINVPMGLNANEKIVVNISDLSAGKLLRGSTTVELNKMLTQSNGTGTTYYNSNAEVQADLLDNTNLIYAAITGSGGSGTGAKMSTLQLGTLLSKLPLEQKKLLDQIAPLSKAKLTADNGVTFETATEAHLQALTLAQLPTRATVTTDVDAMLGAVADGATKADTAVAVAAYINTVLNLPASVKAAATGAVAAASLLADHDAARGAVREAAYNALLVSGGAHEFFLHAYAGPAANALDTTGAKTVAGGDIGAQNTFAATAAAIAAATGTLSADLRAGAVAAAAAGAVTPNGLIDATFVSTGFKVSELGLILKDNVATNISDESNDASRALALDVLKTALKSIQSLQANISSQRGNVNAATDALRATTNVTEQAARAYLDTDYVQAAQEFASNIRTLIAAITALQAANKIPEAAQRLIEAVAR